MKNKKLLIITVSLLALTFVLSACDGVSIEELQSANRMGPDSLNVDLKSDGSSRDSGGSNPKSDDLFDDGSSSMSAGGESSGSMSFDSMSDDSMDDSGMNKLKVKGEIMAVTANSVTIGGISYTFDTTEDLTTLFAVGDFIEVEYLLHDDDSFTLYEFEFEDSLDDDSMDDLYTEVKAYITEVTANTITINGQTFTVDTFEDLTLLFTAGQIYEIEYILNADGTITLLSFELEDDMDDDMDDMDDDSDDDLYDDNNNNNSNDDMNNDDNNNNYNDNDNNNDNNDNSDNNDDNDNNDSDDNS